MKINQSDVISYLKTGKLNKIFYLIAMLVYLIPMFIVLMTNITFGPFFCKITSIIVYIFVIIGQLLTLFKVKKGDNRFLLHIVVLIGLVFAFIERILQ